MNMSKVVIALTSAIVIGGVIRKAGEEVEVTQEFARELLHRGRGTLVQVDAVHDDEHGETIDLSKMKKDELVALAAEYQIENPASFTKEQLIEKISTAAHEAE